MFQLTFIILLTNLPWGYSCSVSEQCYIESFRKISFSYFFLSHSEAVFSLSYGTHKKRSNYVSGWKSFNKQTKSFLPWKLIVVFFFLWGIGVCFWEKWLTTFSFLHRGMILSGMGNLKLERCKLSSIHCT